MLAVFVTLLPGRAAAAPGFDLPPASQRPDTANHGVLDVSALTPDTAVTADAAGPVSSGSTNAAVLNPSQPTYDFDYGSLLFGPPTGNDQLTTLAVDSVNGNDANAGTLAAPKLTLPPTITNGSVLGLFRGSLFRQSLPLSTLGTTHGLAVQDVALGSAKPLPVVSALDPVNTGTVTSNGDGTYSYLWTPGDSRIDNGGYNNVYMVEINTAFEATQPIAARRRMNDVTSQAAAAAATFGSVWMQPPGTGSGQSGSPTQWKAVFRPSYGANPNGSGGFRYEVVSRYCPADWGDGNTNLGDGTMSGVTLIGGSNAYGELSGPLHFAGDRLAFIHATTHNAVFGGGSLQRSVFYDMGDSQSIQLAVYTPDGAGQTVDVSGCIFYANNNPSRGANCLLIHTANGTMYDRASISNCAFLGVQNADGSFPAGSYAGVGFNNVTTGTLSGIYTSQISMPINAPPRPITSNATCTGSVFRDFSEVVLPQTFRNNILAGYTGTNATALNGNTSTQPDPANPGYNGTPTFNDHNLYWLGTRAAGFARIPAHSVHGYNIYVSGYPGGPTNPGDGVGYPGFNLADAPGIVNDYNLVIQFSGFDFRVYTDGPIYTSWAAYRSAQPNLDAHSLYLDLRNDPRGVAAVFANAPNGDFRWANTDVGQQCAAFCAANNVGPATVTTHWPTVPTVDAAVAAFSLLSPQITGPGAATFTNGAYGEYKITTDLDGTPNAPTSYSATGQPTWLTVNASSGVISGTPPQAGTFGVSVDATNAAGTGSAVLGITVQTAFRAWQNAYFTAAELNNLAVSGPNATPAGDGIPNLIKYALGVNPKSNGTGALPKVSITTLGTASFLTLTYNRSLAANDVTCTVEVSGDLRTWTSGVNATTTVSAVNNAANTMQTVVQRDLTPTAGTRQRFIRLKISQP